MSLRADLAYYENECEAEQQAYEKARAMAVDAVKDDPFVHWDQARLEEKLIDEGPPGMILAAVACAYGIDCKPENKAWAGNEARGIFKAFLEAQIESLTQFYLDHA